MSKGFALLVTRMLALVGVAMMIGTAHSTFVRPIALTIDEARLIAQREGGGARATVQPAPDSTDTETVADPGAPDEADEAPESLAATESGAETGAGEPEDASDADPVDGIDVASLREEVTLAEARWLHENAAATFIDARPVEEYEAGHIAGALWMPAPQFEPEAPPNFYFIDNTMPVVIYCGGGDCDASKNTAKRLLFEDPGIRTHIFDIGFPAWEEAGLPIETGPDPLLEDFESEGDAS